MAEFIWIWNPIIAALAVLLCSFAAYCLLIAVRKAAKPTTHKEKTYACGEELKPEEMHPDSEQFFSPVRRVLWPFYRYIQSAHTGALNTYLLWAAVGLIAVLIVILLTAR